MSKKAALHLLGRLEEVLRNSEALADLKGLHDHYTRDVQFLEHAKSCLRLGDHQQIQWVFDQMRNPSQGFGSYSEDQNEIDATLDRLFVELEDALTRRRAKDHIQTAEIDQGKTVKSRFWLRGRRLSL